MRKTDFFIGFHPIILFTWGSVVLIGLISKFFLSSVFSRVSGSLLGASIFFLITNFGVWSMGSYGYTVEGFINFMEFYNMRNLVPLVQYLQIFGVSNFFINICLFAKFYYLFTKVLNVIGFKSTNGINLT